MLGAHCATDDAKAWLLQGIAKSREEQRACHQTVVQEIRTEIKEPEVLMDRLYDDRLHRLISEDFFRQRLDLLEEKRRQLSRDLARHQHAEGAYMELGSKAHRTHRPGATNIRASGSGATARTRRPPDIEPRPEGQITRI